VAQGLTSQILVILVGTDLEFICRLLELDHRHIVSVSAELCAVLALIC